MGSPCPVPAPGTWASAGVAWTMMASNRVIIRAANTRARAALRNRVFIAGLAPVGTARAPGVPPRWAVLREFREVSWPVTIGRPQAPGRTQPGRLIRSNPPPDRDGRDR